MMRADGEDRSGQGHARDAVQPPADTHRGIVTRCKRCVVCCCLLCEGLDGRRGEGAEGVWGSTCSRGPVLRGHVQSWKRRRGQRAGAKDREFCRRRSGGGSSRGRGAANPGLGEDAKTLGQGCGGRHAMRSRVTLVLGRTMRKLCRITVLRLFSAPRPQGRSCWGGRVWWHYVKLGDAVQR
jgi:hypothetical protein